MRKIYQLEHYSFQLVFEYFLFNSFFCREFHFEHHLWAGVEYWFGWQTECLSVQQQLADELMINSERIRTLTGLRREERKCQEMLQKNHHLLVMLY